MFVNKKIRIKAKKNKMNKKAISELVSYVLLIVLAIAMAGAAWLFLKPYAEKPLPEEECPEGISIVLENYSCDGTTMTYALRNRGLHNVDGVKLNVINTTTNFEETLQWILPNCNNVPNCTECSNSICFPAAGEPFVNSINYVHFGSIEKIAIYPIKINEKGFAEICSLAVLKIPIENCFANP